jgi:hypothetical protein
MTHAPIALLFIAGFCLYLILVMLKPRIKKVFETAVYLVIFIALVIFYLKYPERRPKTPL